jgi:hypothetical protein
MARLHREACGVPGCDFVAGPSRDQNRVQRLRDQHRATAHRLDVEALKASEAKARRRPQGTQAEYREQSRARAKRIVPHLATYRRFEGAPPDLAALEAAVQAERESAQAYYARGAQRDGGARARARVSARRVEAQARLAELAAEAWSRTA